MLKTLSIRSFKAYDSIVKVPFSPFTVLIGPNGSGKTTVLQAIDLLGGVVRGTLSEHLAQQGWDYSDLPHLLSARQRFGVSAELELGEEFLEWDLVLETRRRPGIHREAVRAAEIPLLEREGRKMWRAENASEEVTQTLTSSWLATLDLKTDAARFPRLTEVAGWAQGIRNYLFLDPLQLRGRSRVADDLGPAGSTVAGFLAQLFRHRKDAFERVVQRVRKHYPRLVKLEVKGGRYGWNQLIVSERWGSTQAAFNARQVSDGLLRLIAVSAMYEVIPSPRVILLDEIENGLHPSLLKGLVEMLQELTVSSKGKTQVVVTTHSPVALNYVRSAEQVLLVHRSAAGAAQLTPMSSTSGYAKLREHFDLGELWLNAGEARLLGAGA